MKLKRFKKVPNKPLQGMPGDELSLSKSGNDVRLVLNSDGKIYQLSFVATESAPASGGSGGTTNHAALTNLAYASSGHTGFQPTSTLTTKGDIYARDNSDVNRLAVGSDGQLIVPDSPSTVGMKWGNLVFNNDEIVANDDEIVTV